MSLKEEDIFNDEVQEAKLKLAEPYTITDYFLMLALFTFTAFVWIGFFWLIFKFLNFLG